MPGPVEMYVRTYLPPYSNARNPTAREVPVRTCLPISDAGWLVVAVAVGCGPALRWGRRTPSLLGQPSRTLSQKIAREGMGRVGRKELAGVLAAARREATGPVRNVPSTLPSRERRRRTGGAARTSPPCYAVDRLGAQNKGWSVA